ncbi:MAG: hypothetical protein A2817_01685 [Candidatus Yanofskybacteria bacterium RIFCSPHIGHO2_01_FULL_39_8b]|uniref:UDP-N-acetylmuramoyl-tripeptide--D-alanyl-D-alanine ligase n=1 Tax=Candidatus Yanofskybacteria bacterium RIFCSPHIGHO2_01_FULL_39_8b TaxID=1802659 RepID=A0A1F8EDV0_9BACT|nr:MAG: hypothetical protein A2817_01685 [Candidatus Yanofskybacteria bacterium RIFCSPHIGHO2_01_FULL_39_8b]
MKLLLQFALNMVAELYIWRYKPTIIAITGNVGKTSTKEAITAVLGSIKKVRSGKGNLNNEFGVPLTIIGDWANQYYETGNSFWFWLKVLIVSCWSLVVGQNYLEVLILEYGADRPGDIKKLADKFKPHIGVVTAVGEIPVHVEYFQDPDHLAKEKSKLVSILKPADYAILNHDDPAVYDMREKTRAKIMSYGFTAHFQDTNDNRTEESMNFDKETVKLSNFDIRLDSDDKPSGVGFKFHYGNNASFVPVVLHGVLGKSQALAAGAAAAIGIIYGMNLIQISQALADYKGPSGRLKILKGIKNSVIIDDTYNSSPAAMHLAFETLKSLPAKRKVAIIGDMLELGKYTIEAHQEMGTLAGGIADVLVTVGLRGKILAHAAENQMSTDSIFSFPTSNLAKIKIQELIQEGDLILVKGSQGMRMEKIVEEIMAEPERKKELLVRQGKKWLNN